MAPPFKIGKPKLSLVRIPGSGQDTSLKPVCLNVAQISACARILGPIVNFNFEHQIANGTLSISPVARSSLSSNPRNSDVSSSHRNNDHRNEGANAKRSYAAPHPRYKYVFR